MCDVDDDGLVSLYKKVVWGQHIAATLHLTYFLP